MLRKTKCGYKRLRQAVNASMRPQRNAAENKVENLQLNFNPQASMRPQRNAAENANNVLEITYSDGMLQ